MHISRFGPFAVFASAIIVFGCGKKTVQTPPAPAIQVTPPADPAPPTLSPPETAPSDVVLGDVYFDFDRATLREDALATLTDNARALMQNRTISIVIEGHCDERGTVNYNLALGESRARAAKDFLVSYGVSAERVTITSYGENRPFATGHNEAAWAQNRRAHFVLEALASRAQEQ